MMMEDYSGGYSGGSPIGYGTCWDDEYEPRHGGGTTTTTTPAKSEEPYQYVGEYGEDPKNPVLPL